ncbi:hypothetical protein J2Z40_000333 [Cytobacillus eiseniae]|uniref:YpzI family protein n=1 Tax=Cytobacillus eiseniae TaxID=762947 RepID=A0ABS4RA67_9BACI|nr:hypothetical protein [Cytobacillus eiseniae]MBP2239780.1 hypothetical protein [Cytobacillus eiseniae]
MKKQTNKRQQETTGKDQFFPNDYKYRGNSLDEHHSIETANVLQSEKELGQQNENL